MIFVILNWNYLLNYVGVSWILFVIFVIIFSLAIFTANKNNSDQFLCRPIIFRLFKKNCNCLLKPALPWLYFTTSLHGSVLVSLFAKEKPGFLQDDQSHPRKFQVVQFWLNWVLLGLLANLINFGLALIVTKLRSVHE